MCTRILIYIIHALCRQYMSHLLTAALFAQALAWDEPNVLDKLSPPPLVMTVLRWLACKGRISTRCYAPS